LGGLGGWGDDVVGPPLVDEEDPLSESEDGAASLDAASAKYVGEYVATCSGAVVPSQAESTHRPVEWRRNLRPATSRTRASREQERGSGDWTRTSDLRLMKPSL
jgi:hypothetical protein